MTNEILKEICVRTYLRILDRDLQNRKISLENVEVDVITRSLMRSRRICKALLIEICTPENASVRLSHQDIEEVVENAFQEISLSQVRSCP